MSSLLLETKEEEIKNLATEHDFKLISIKN